MASYLEKQRSFRGQAVGTPPVGVTVIGHVHDGVAAGKEEAAVETLEAAAALAAVDPDVVQNVLEVTMQLVFQLGGCPLVKHLLPATLPSTPGLSDPISLLFAPSLF